MFSRLIPVTKSEYIPSGCIKEFSKKVISCVQSAYLSTCKDKSVMQQLPALDQAMSPVGTQIDTAVLQNDESDAASQ